MTDHEMNQIFKRALSSDELPADTLNRSIIRKVKEKEMKKKTLYKNLLTTAAAAAVFLGISTTALAAYQILSAPKAAEEMQYRELGEAFEKGNSIENEVSKKGGEFNVTLLGLLTGERLDSSLTEGLEIVPERTYAAVGISRTDGKPMREDDGNKIFVSPLIEGLNPVQYNIATMNGSKFWKVIDGVLYFFVNCDDITCFSDRNIYLAVQSGAFYDVTAYSYDDATGQIAANKSFTGMNLLFELPADKSQADPDKAAAYLEELERQWNASAEPEEENPMPDVNEIVKNATLIQDSVKEVKQDAQGVYNYEYLFGYIDGLENKTTFSTGMPLFEEDEYGYWLATMSEDMEGNETYLVFHKDQSGKITGMIYERKK